MNIIEIEHLTKEYRLGQVYNVKQTFQNTLSRLRGQPVATRTRFKALDDVNVSFQKGEVVGIIGPNGAGKSTLLKMLARISQPTTGEVRVNGSIAPLIELGAGLVPDLTGRENIYLNGSILGIPRRTIRTKFDEIVAFSELEEFIDTPIKRYSSGMKVRLGFSIATSVEADILIVDEVLAVGDLAFQRKCFDRMEELIKRESNTVLLVSHNIRQVERLSSRVLMLDHGRIVADGNPAEVCTLFYRQSNEKIKDYHREKLASLSKTHSSGEVELIDISVLDQDGRIVEKLESGSTLTVRVRFEVKQFLEKPEIIVGTHTTDFLYLSAASTAVYPDRPDCPPGIHEVDYIVPSLPFAPGTYCVRLAIFDRYRRKVFGGETLKVFDVLSTVNEIYEAPMRNLNLPTEWRMNGRRYTQESGQIRTPEEAHDTANIVSPKRMQASD